MSERQYHQLSNTLESNEEVADSENSAHRTPRLPRIDNIVESRHTRHLSHEEWTNYALNSARCLDRPSYSLGESPGHRRRKSVNPLERAAEDALYSSRLETARTTARSPISLSSTARIAPTPEGLEGDEVDHGSRKIEPAGSFVEEEGSVRTSPEEYEEEGDLRSIVLTVPNCTEKKKFCGNAIVTSKYNFATFLPKFLFKMFSRVAYIYFLLQATLSWWPAVSPYSGLGPTAGLAFVLSVAAIKEIVEDKKRHQADLKTNTSITRVLAADGTFVEKEWQHIEVGDVIQVNDDELIPADLLCIHTALPDEVCFIKTANLDGESNLKIRRPITLANHVQYAHAGCASPSDDNHDPPSPPLTSPATYRSTFMTSEWMKSFQCVKAVVHTEGPSSNLSSINGCVNILNGKDQLQSNVPLTMNEMLLRGCTLKNSGFVLGLVIYTGAQTRIQMNNRRVPFKVGSFDTYLNVQIILLLFLQCCICLGCALASLLWRDEQGVFRYYLAFEQYSWDANNENPVFYTLLNLLTNWILYSYMIPISLFVSNEIVKFWQTFIFINYDKEMKDPVSGEHARARNSNVVEDLGKVSYIFSDKTGTLTSNDMRLRAIGLGGLNFGSKDRALELEPEMEPPDALRYFDTKLAVAGKFLPDPKEVQDLSSQFDYVTALNGEKQQVEDDINYERLGRMLHEFFLAICICHSLIVESGDSGKPSFQGPSPDEVALVETAQRLGFEFRVRSSKHITLAFNKHIFKYEILNVLEFSSDRRKMSVIARGPDGVIRLFCKGADAAILSCLKNYKILPDGESLMRATDRSLTHFASQGLRTMCVASKIIPEDTYEEWDRRYQEAATSLEDRDLRIGECAEEIEKNLNLLGITAIEDKLQDGVPETIEMLSKAGIKVFMITGDKQETAISIAISCRLIQDSDKVMICNEESEEATRNRLLQLIQDCDESKYYTSGYLQPSQRMELVIDGSTLGTILGSHSERLLAELASKCATVVVCRASPAQKAAVIKLMKEYQIFSHSKLYSSGKPFSRLAKLWYSTLWKVWDGRMLAIGDGANDVAMLQSADVGIGIAGKEGRQAVNNSDFAISQFRFLGRLLLVHGQLSYYRLAHLIKYSFYKNISFAMVFFFYQFYCGFSGQAIIDSMSATIYNVILTSLPVLILATLDKPLQIKSFLLYPQTYNNSRALSCWNFWKATLLKSFLTSALSFFVPFFALSANGQHGMDGIFALGKTVYIALLGIIGIEILVLSRSWTKLFVFAVLLSTLVVFAFLPLYEAILMAFKYPMAEYYGIPDLLFTSPTFWLSIFICYAVAFGVRLVDRAIKLHLSPEDYDILSELRVREKSSVNNHSHTIEMPVTSKQNGN